MKNIGQKMTQLITVATMMLASIELQPLFAQTGVRIAGTAGTADNSAMLDVVSSTKGVLIPRMLESERTAISSPATGLIVYQTNNSKGIYYFDGAVWVQLAAGALSGSGANDFLARWSGGGLTTGATRDNGTNVGIGTAPTSNKLEVAGTANVTSNLSVGGTTTVTGASALNGGLSTQGTASTSFGTNAQILVNTANANGGGIMVSDDGGFFDFNDGPVTFNGTNGLVIAGNSGAASSNCYLKVKQLAGTGSRPVWADAAGQLNVSGRSFNSNATESGDNSTGTPNVISTTMTVASGEVISISGAVELRNTGGSGNDRFKLALVISGACGTITQSTYISSWWANSDHNSFYTTPLTDVWVATCSGSVTFTFTAARFDADDTWHYRNARILAVKE